jgi:hypothetical protein
MVRLKYLLLADDSKSSRLFSVEQDAYWQHVNRGLAPEQLELTLPALPTLPDPVMSTTEPTKLHPVSDPAADLLLSDQDILSGQDVRFLRRTGRLSRGPWGLCNLSRGVTKKCVHPAFYVFDSAPRRTLSSR